MSLDFAKPKVGTDFLKWTMCKYRETLFLLPQYSAHQIREERKGPSPVLNTQATAQAA